MTVRVNRTFDVALPREEAWDMLSDPAERAAAISVVDEFEAVDGDEFLWYISIPVPGIRRRLKVRTRDVERRPPEFVRFEGKSRLMDVMGEHELADHDDGTRIVNRFVVESSVPGVERFFKRNLDAELENIMNRLSSEVEAADSE